MICPEAQVSNLRPSARLNAPEQLRVEASCICMQKDSQEGCCRVHSTLVGVVTYGCGAQIFTSMANLSRAKRAVVHS